jgi:hypothetical protein
VTYICLEQNEEDPFERLKLVGIDLLMDKVDGEILSGRVIVIMIDDAQPLGLGSLFSLVGDPISLQDVYPPAVTPLQS